MPRPEGRPPRRHPGYCFGRTAFRSVRSLGAAIVALRPTVACHRDVTRRTRQTSTRPSRGQVRWHEGRSCLWSNAPPPAFACSNRRVSHSSRSTSVFRCSTARTPEAPPSQPAMAARRFGTRAHPSPASTENFHRNPGTQGQAEPSRSTANLLRFSMRWNVWSVPAGRSIRNPTGLFQCETL